MKHIPFITTICLIFLSQFSFGQLEYYYWDHQSHPAKSSKWVDSMEVSLIAKNEVRYERITYFPSGRISEIIFENESRDIDSVLIYLEYSKQTKDGYAKNSIGKSILETPKQQERIKYWNNKNIKPLVFHRYLESDFNGEEKRVLAVARQGSIADSIVYSYEFQSTLVTKIHSFKSEGERCTHFLHERGKLTRLNSTLYKNDSVYQSFSTFDTNDEYTEVETRTGVDLINPNFPVCTELPSVKSELSHFTHIAAFPGSESEATNNYWNGNLIVEFYADEELENRDYYLLKLANGTLYVIRRNY